MAEPDPAVAGWEPKVETRMVLGADRVAIEVIDNGVGLPKQNRYRLLEPYVTTKGHKGTGLGLAMVQKITEQHGGTLTLDDADKIAGHGRGAVVRMTLPYTPGGAPAPRAEAPQAGEKRTATSSIA
jgi:two-component system nitrogen regulation sensor histidine kinase NtrY